MPEISTVGSVSTPVPPAEQSQQLGILFASAVKIRWWTTPAELARYQEHVGSIFHRKDDHSEDRNLYRVVDMCPEFTGTSGDDLQDISDPDSGQYIYEKKGIRATGYMYKVRYVIEVFHEHPTDTETATIDGVKQTRKKRIMNPRDHFRPYAADFLAKHQLRVAD